MLAMLLKNKGSCCADEIVYELNFFQGATVSFFFLYIIYLLVFPVLSLPEFPMS